MPGEDLFDFSGFNVSAPTPEFSMPSFSMPALETPGLSDLNVSRYLGESGLPGVAPTVPGAEKGFSFGDFFGGVGDAVTKYAGPVSKILGAGSSLAQIPLSIAGLNVARQGQKALQGAIQTEQQAAAPQIAAENVLLPAGTKALTEGVLPPALQEQVDNQVNQARQALLDQLTRAGVDPQTASSMIETQLEQLKNELTLQAGQALLAGGSSTATGATSAAGQGGTLGQAEFQTASNSLTGANQALMRLLSGTA